MDRAPHFDFGDFSTHGIVHDPQQTAQMQSNNMFATPIESMMQTASMYRKKIEAPLTEAETADKIRKTHKADALDQGYTAVERLEP